MMFRGFLLFIALIIMPLPAVSKDSCSAIESRTAAHDFYATIDRNKIFSVPSAKELKKLKPFVTESLYALLASAASAEKKEYQRSKGSEPPLFEGSLFSTWAEGYTNFYIAESVAESNTKEVYVLFQYAQHLDSYYADKPGIMEWKERILIGNGSGKCLVDDIYYAPDSGSRSLKQRLEDVSSHAQ